MPCAHAMQCAADRICVLDAGQPDIAAQACYALIGGKYELHKNDLWNDIRDFTSDLCKLWN